MHIQVRFLILLIFLLYANYYFIKYAEIVYTKCTIVVMVAEYAK